MTARIPNAMAAPLSATAGRKKIRARTRDAILQSLRSGVVPRRGLQYVQVGRNHEVRALLKDLERIADGGSAVRFIIGAYGSGKTFFMHLVRSIAMEQKHVTMHADLAPDRRLHASGGQARSLYQELTRNLSTRSKPEGGALPSVVESFVTQAIKQSRQEGVSPEGVIRNRLSDLSELVGGYDFAEVIAAYWRAYDTGDDELKTSAIRWLRGEFSTKTDARKALGVRTIVTDANVYDQLKLLSRFVSHAGYAGLFVCVDEMVNLYRLNSGKARQSNYEQLLRIVNDSLQGVSSHIGFVFCGTPELLLDTRKGLYSYEALQSRLLENPFAVDGRIDFSGPVLRLANLTPEDMFVLLRNLRTVFTEGAGLNLPAALLNLPDAALEAFMAHCSERIGEAYFRTPRNTIKAFVSLLSVLEQNPTTSWEALLSDATIEVEHPNAPQSRQGSAGALMQVGEDEDDELATFRL